MKYTATSGSETFEITVDEQHGQMQVSLNGKPVRADFVKLAKRNGYSLLLDNVSYEMTVEANAGTYQVYLDGESFLISIKSERESRLAALTSERARQAGGEEIRAPMPGLVVEVEVKQGDAVTKGSGLVIIEAMKMENELKSPVNGTVKEVRVQKGDAVEKGHVLVIIE